MLSQRTRYILIFTIIALSALLYLTGCSKASYEPECECQCDQIKATFKCGGQHNSLTTKLH